MKTINIKKASIIPALFFLSSICFAQFFPGGGYQGGNLGSGGDETLNVPSIDLDLKLFLEGPYNGTDMNTSLNTNGYLPLLQPYDVDPTAKWYYTGNESIGFIPNADVVDWILVELRETPYIADSAKSSTMISRRAALLLKDGSVVDIDGVNQPKFYVTLTDNLFVVIWHRNHIGILSQNALTGTAGVYSYDFSSAATQVFGGLNGHKHLGGGVYGMAGGDGDPDGQITNSDKIDVWMQEAGLSGYLAGDFSMDSQVNNLDKIDIWAPNSGMGSQVPDFAKATSGMPDSGYNCQVPD